MIRETVSQLSSIDGAPTSEPSERFQAAIDDVIRLTLALTSTIANLAYATGARVRGELECALSRAQALAECLRSGLPAIPNHASAGTSDADCTTMPCKSRPAAVRGSIGGPWRGVDVTLVPNSATKRAEASIQMIPAGLESIAAQLRSALSAIRIAACSIGTWAAMDRRAHSMRSGALPRQTASSARCGMSNSRMKTSASRSRSRCPGFGSR